MAWNPGSNLPPGSMKGSGVDSYDFDEYLTCPLDGTRDLRTVYVDDWGHKRWTCDECGAEIDFDPEDVDDAFIPPEPNGFGEYDY